MSASPTDSDDDDRTRIVPRAAVVIPTTDDKTELLFGGIGSAGLASDKTEIAPRGESAAEPDMDFSHGGGNALPIGLRLGEFELQSVLGEGGFGIVYLAWDSSLERKVAVKEYMPSALASRGSNSTHVSVKSERHRETFELGRKSFINEAKLLAQFDHPSLVKVYRFWEAHGTAYMVMPFYEGKTLKDALTALKKPPDEAWLMAMLAPLTEALNVIHREQCYHRDIAPDNIMLLAGSGRPLLLDFGAARRVIGDMTQALTVILKPGYAPLEQYAEVASMKQGPWTDVYALCAVVYFAIAGKTPPPSVGRMMGDTMIPLASIAKGRYSERFVNAIEAGLRIRPDERTLSIDDFRAQIGLDLQTHQGAETRPVQYRDPLAVAAPPAPSPEPPPAMAAAPTVATSGGHRRLLLGGLGGLAVLGAGGGIYMALAPSGERARPKPVEAETVPAPSPVAVADAPVPAAPVAVAAVPTSLRAEQLALLQAIYDKRLPAIDARLVLSSQRLVIDRDALTFAFTPNRESYAYLLFLDQDGIVNLIFPSYGFEENRVKAGQKIDMPKGVALAAGDPAGAWTFMLILSALPRDFSRFGQQSAKNMGWLALDAKAAGGGLLGSAICRPGAECKDEYGAVMFEAQLVKP
ncbi:hypothetical protein BH11PSE10_BH11PSE10_13570 [soil metagenome]